MIEEINLPENGLPPWDQDLTPRSAIAWLTYDPLTKCNLGDVVADNVLSVLAKCGFKIVANGVRATPMTMIEKVARVLCKVHGDIEGEEWDFDYFVEEIKGEYLQMARAAIEAMQEPTEAMKNAEAPNGDRVHWDYSCQMCGGAKFAWETMISAADKDGEP